MLTNISSVALGLNVYSYVEYIFENSTYNWNKEKELFIKKYITLAREDYLQYKQTYSNIDVWQVVSQARVFNGTFSNEQQNLVDIGGYYLDYNTGLTTSLYLKSVEELLTKDIKCRIRLIGTIW